MNIITTHEFLEKGGQLVLLLNVVSFEQAVEPVLLVSKNTNTAYLRRAPDDIHEILDVNINIIDAVRKAKVVDVVELMGKKVTHSYEAPTAILDDNEA